MPIDTFDFTTTLFEMVMRKCLKYEYSKLHKKWVNGYSGFET